MARNIIARFIPVFPANAIGAGGISVEKSGGAFTISTDFDQFSDQEGSVLYRGSTGWQALLRGQNGQVLKSTPTSIEWSTSAADQTFIGEQPIVVNTVGNTTTTSFNPDYYSPNDGALIARLSGSWVGLDKGSTGQILKSTATGIAWENEATATGERNIVWCGTAVGSNGLTLTPSPPITSYERNQLYSFLASGTNSGPMQANISGLGFLDMEINQQPITQGMVVQDVYHYLQYDGTKFQTFSTDALPIQVARELTTDPATGPSQGVFYAKDSGGSPMPYFRTENNGTVIPLGVGGGPASNNIVFASYSTSITTSSSSFIATPLTLNFTAQTTGEVWIIGSVPVFCVRAGSGQTSLYSSYRLYNSSDSVVLQSADIGHTSGNVAVDEQSYQVVCFAVKTNLAVGVQKTIRFDYKTLNADQAGAFAFNQIGTLMAWEV